MSGCDSRVRFSPRKESTLQVGSTSQNVCSVWSFPDRPVERMQPARNKPPHAGHTATAGLAFADASNNNTSPYDHWEKKRKRKFTWMLVCVFWSIHITWANTKETFYLFFTPILAVKWQKNWTGNKKKRFTWWIVLPDEPSILYVVLGSKVHDHRRPKLIDSLHLKTQRNKINVQQIICLV